MCVKPNNIIIVNKKTMKLTKKYPLLGSSVNPEEISLTIKSLGIALIPVILAIIKALGYDAFTESDVIVVVNGLATLVATVGVVWGVLRKFKK